jgi:hypothetical protein
MDIRNLFGREIGWNCFFRNKIALIFLFILLSNFIVFSSVQTPDLKKGAEIKKEFSSIRIHIKTPGKLLIDQIFIKELIEDENLISNILTGDHNFTVIYKDFKESYVFNVKKNSIEEIFFYHTDNNLKFEKINTSINNDDNIINDVQKKILDKTYELLGKPPYSKVVVNDKIFTLDCIGFIEAVFYSAGFDIQKEIARYPGNNGVTKLFNYLNIKKEVHQKKIPEVGDIIIWDNTWDYNNDGRFGNDPLTHAGFVTKVDPDGTVHFVHVHITLGVVVERLNLYKPNQRFDKTGKEINTPMHAQSALNFKKNLPYLSGELWRTSGKFLKND